MLYDDFAEFIELMREYDKLADEDLYFYIDREPLPNPPKEIHMKNFILDRRQKIHRCRNNC